MKKKLNKLDFIREFEHFNHDLTIEGIIELWHFFEEMEADLKLNKDLTLDFKEICSNFTQMKNDDFMHIYNLKSKNEIKKFLNDKKSFVCFVNNSVIFKLF